MRNEPTAARLSIARAALADHAKRLTSRVPLTWRAPSERTREVTPTVPARALERWQALGRQMLDADFELDVESLAPVVATFNQLRRAGVHFDGTLTALVRAIERQAFRSVDCAA